MAQRFGGNYSPKTSPGAAAVKKRQKRAKARRAGARSNLMFVPPVILLFTSLTSGAIGLSLGLIGAASLALGAWLLRDGLLAEAAYNERNVARRPAIPRKLFGAALTGLGVAFAVFQSGGGIIAPALFGGITIALHVVAFGIDPLKDKGSEEIDAFQQNRVARVVEEVEAQMEEMRKAITKTSDRHLVDRLERFLDAVAEMVRTVEEDPRDLTSARKYLSVYLQGARDATTKFVELYTRNGSPSARQDYETLLQDLEENFEAKTAKLLADDQSALNVEIDVLRERLGRDGVYLEKRAQN